MHNIIKTALFALVLALTSPVAAQDFDAGWKAYERGDYAAALREFRPLADQGHADAQYILGLMYRFGRGVARDSAEAVRWYRKAADQGDAEAQINLGLMSGAGQGVPQDYAEAVKWYRMAADQGDATAQLYLGLMYRNGQGVSQDYVLAHMWFNLAASGGYKNANSNRNIVAGRMTSQQIAEAEKLAREWKPK